MKKLLISVLVTTLAFTSTLVLSAWKKDESVELDVKAQEALTEFRAADPGVENFISQSVGYVVIPTVGKADFVNGMAIFTQAKGGLMYEASVGGQKFKVELK